MGTGYRLQPEIIQMITEYIEAGKKDYEIVAATGVRRNCVARLRQRIRYLGVAYPPALAKPGRPSKLRQAHLDALRDYLSDYPQAYLEEMIEFLEDEHGVTVGASTVYRGLERIQWSRKVASKCAKEQSEPLRRTFAARIQHLYKARQIVAVDESACNERTGDRKYGWSPINIPVELEYSIKRSERWSVLPAITVDGYLSFTMIQGSITAEIFEEFLELNVLPYCAAGYSVIVMDNASIHRSGRVEELCRSFGVDIEYLPPYSPDFNLIEKSFKVLKSWIKRNAKLAAEFMDFQYFLYYAVQQACCGVDCWAWFEMCGYPAFLTND